MVLDWCHALLSVLFGLGLLEVFGLQEWTGWDGAGTAFELAEGADSVIK